MLDSHQVSLRQSERERWRRVETKCVVADFGRVEFLGLKGRTALMVLFKPDEQVQCRHGRESIVAALRDSRATRVSMRQ